MDTTLAPQPTSNVVFVTDTVNTQGSSETPSSPLDVTMLAMLGLTMAGAGVMKSQSAQKKQQELAQANAVAQAQLATAKAEQAQTATANWAENQTIQANGSKKVYTQVQQSQANIDFWASYAAWKIKVAEAEEKRRQAELIKSKPVIVRVRRNQNNNNNMQQSDLASLRLAARRVKPFTRSVKNQQEPTPTPDPDTETTQQPFYLEVWDLINEIVADSLGSHPNPVLLFGGGRGRGNPSEPGPQFEATDEMTYTIYDVLPSWVEVATEIIPYPGSKRGQFSDVLGNYSNSDNILLVGYSSGGDTTLMYAYNYIQDSHNTGTIDGIVILGGTMSGEMPDGTLLQNRWEDVLDELLLYGIDIYILNDGALYGDEARNYQVPDGAEGRFCYDDTRSQFPHYHNDDGQGVNNNDELRDGILDWINGDGSCPAPSN